MSTERFVWVCPQCGNPDVQASAWVNTDEIESEEGRFYCPRCEYSTGRGEGWLWRGSLMRSVLAALEGVDGCCCDNEPERERIALEVLRALDFVS
jgi:hypothetical protein